MDLHNHHYNPHYNEVVTHDPFMMGGGLSYMQHFELALGASPM
jgi:hypothetical protein